jgi:hypothetical protein
MENRTREGATQPATQPVAVEVPEEPPELSQAAAGALLRLLMAVAESDARSTPGRDRAA